MKTQEAKQHFHRSGEPCYKDHKLTIHQPTPTPTPWRVIPPTGNFTNYTLVNTKKGEPFRQGDEIADVFDDGSAAYIVRAVNAHEKLLQIAKTFQRYLANQKGHNCYKLCDDIAQALAQAEGK